MVSYSSSNTLKENLFRAAERKCRDNVRDFAGRRVLVEGGGYNKIWLETQPMGGAMYAVRDMEAGLNNILLFMENIREDGRLPGSIEHRDGVLLPQYDKFQGFCFAEPALDMYYLAHPGSGYLDQLEDTLSRFDAYLWKYRDSDGDGCLETWCKFDTGEDNTLRLGNAPNYWIGEDPPAGYDTIPVASMDFMGYSYSCRSVLAEIAAVRGDRRSELLWRAKAAEVAAKMRSYLWDEGKGALFDRDKDHRQIPCLIHNTLRCMYWSAVSPGMADRFVRGHVLNPEEFWTPMPLPSVAANDPLFRNIPTNSWTGQAEALTYQRAIRAFENYGWDRLLPVLGNKLFGAIGEECVFVQQYDPFTGKPSERAFEEKQDSYGPALLSVLEYIARIDGVSYVRGKLVWSASEDECEYQLQLGDGIFRTTSGAKGTECFIGSRKVLALPKGSKVVTDLEGEVIRVCRMEE